MRTATRSTYEVYINTQEFIATISALTGLYEDIIEHYIGKHTSVEVFGEPYLSTITARRVARSAMKKISKRADKAEAMERLAELVELLSTGAEGQTYNSYMITLHTWGLRITHPEIFNV